MSSYFFDSSGLVKYFVTEVGSQWVRNTIYQTALHAKFIAHISEVEVMSAVSRRVREGTVSARQSNAIRINLRRNVQRNLNRVRFSDTISEAAIDLTERHPLRAMDAIQLASAVIINQRLLAAGESALIFVAADQRLLTAAQGEGFQTEDPNQYP